MDPISEIKRLYYATSPETIRRDLARAIDLLKSLGSEEERECVAVYMDGLSQMRSEWAARAALEGTGGPGARDADAEGANADERQHETHDEDEDGQCRRRSRNAGPAAAHLQTHWVRGEGADRCALG